MASFGGHLRGGVASTGVAFVLIGAGMYYTGHLTPYLTVDEWPKLPILLAIGLLSSFFPDIDIHSKSQRVLYWVMLIADLVLIWQRNYEAAALLGLFGLIPPLGKHRGWTHTWTAALLVPAVFFFGFPMLMGQDIQTFLVVCFLVSVSAYVSHLVLDGYIGKSVKKARRLMSRHR